MAVKLTHEMAQAWQGEISDRTIGKARAENWIYQKKKLTATLERNEEKRQEFIGKISQKKPENRVYIDESGIDNREDYGYDWNSMRQRFHDLKS